MKVVYLLDWYLFYVTELSNAMAEDHEVLVIPRDHNFEISSPSAPLSLEEYLRTVMSEKVQTDRLRYRRGDPRSLLDVLRLQLRISRWGADVVHVQETVDWRIVLLTLLNRRRTIVLTIHDVASHPGESRGLQGFLYRLMVRAADKIVVHGEALRRQLRESAGVAPGTEVASIPHGVFSLYRAWDDEAVAEEPHSILFFGRIAPYKGLEDLIAAQPLVSAVIPDARFIIAGAGPFERHAATMADPAAFEIHNRFISNQEVPRLFRRAGVVVLPYVEASQSGVIPIAYEFGKPVVATRVGGLPEVVDDGVSGIVVEPGDPQQLAAAIIRLLRDPELRQRLGRGARHLAETRLCWKSIAARTAQVYAESGS